jgi:hypothetical protein
MKYRVLSAISLTSIVLAIAACSSGSSTTASTTSIGQVVDAPVVGLAYVCSTSSGLTVSAVPQDGIVTPQDMAVVLRASTDDLNALAIAQFLQSINSSATPGVITISS